MHSATILKLVIFYAESAPQIDQQFIFDALCVALHNLEDP
jgi:hypothetical protein